MDLTMSDPKAYATLRPWATWISRASKNCPSAPAPVIERP